MRAHPLELRKTWLPTGQEKTALQMDHAPSKRARGMARGFSDPSHDSTEKGLRPHFIRGHTHEDADEVTSTEARHTSPVNSRNSPIAAKERARNQIQRHKRRSPEETEIA